MMEVLPLACEFFNVETNGSLTEIAVRYWVSPFRNTVQFYVLLAFFFICGISCTLSRANYRRGLLLALCALGITGVTFVLEDWTGGDFSVKFGVLHMLSAAILTYALLDFLVSLLLLPVRGAKAKKIASLALGYLPALIGIILLCVYFAKFGYLSDYEGYPAFYSKFLPTDNAQTNEALSYFFLVKYYRFTMSDYFPLLPWSAFVLIGSGIGRAVYHTPAKYAFRSLNGCWNTGFRFVGRHAAVIYLGHMVVIPALVVAAVAACALLL